MFSIYFKIVFVCSTLCSVVELQFANHSVIPKYHCNRDGCRLERPITYTSLLPSSTSRFPFLPQRSFGTLNPLLPRRYSSNVFPPRRPLAPMGPMPLPRTAFLPRKPLTQFNRFPSRNSFSRRSSFTPFSTFASPDRMTPRSSFSSARQISTLSKNPQIIQGKKLHRTIECEFGQCIPYYNCLQQERSQSNFCILNNGFTGVCCKNGHLEPNRIPNRLLRNNFSKINFEQSEVNNVIREIKKLEDELFVNQIAPKRNTKEFLHQNFFGSNPLALKEMQDAFQVLQAFIHFSKREKLTPEEIIRGQFDIRNSSFASFCEKNPVCNNNRYRVPDGTCNNLINTSQGKAVSAFTRLLPPEYADGINEPRRAKDGGELPNPRTVSLSLSPEAQIENNYYSLMLMQFGQFVDHDLTRTAITRTHNDMQISCCDEKVISNPRLTHPACFPIPVPQQDNLLRSESQVCINFVRSAPAINSKCKFGPRDQLNQISAYLDGNNIYGSSDMEAMSLREFRDGRLKVSNVHNKPFLPFKFNTTNSNCQIPKTMQMKCFIGGDIRANEVTDLVVLHAIWLREHNRIADNLLSLNPSWNDEMVYQETKRIVVAQFQHIIYNELLPLIVGTRTMSHFKLHLNSGFSNSYNPIIDVSILNEFSTAAYRLHSLIQGTLNMNTPDNRVLGTISLRDTFNNPKVLYDAGGFEMRIAGLTGQAINGFDNFFTKDVTNHLFQIPGKRFGLDLVAINIQRGRDHGIPGYVKYRDICGLRPVRSFNDLKSIFSDPNVADVMKQLYRHIEDVDLFIAGSSEKPIPGSVVGPTFACIIGEQFRRIKEGDRFWYENGNMDTSFTAAQLAEIRKATLSRILCDNSDIGIMQKNAFLMPSMSNPKVNCQSNIIPTLNLLHWKM